MNAGQARARHGGKAQLPTHPKPSGLGGASGPLWGQLPSSLRPPGPLRGVGRSRTHAQAFKGRNGELASSAQGAESCAGQRPLPLGPSRSAQASRPGLPEPLPALLQGGDAAPPFPEIRAYGEVLGSRSLPPPRRAPSPARGRLRWRRGGGAERRGGLLAGVQPGLAPSFASGQEAEPRVEGPTAGSGARPSPALPRGPSPALGPGMRLCYPISRAALGPLRPHSPAPPAPAFAPSGLETPRALPYPASPVASKLPGSRRAGGTPLPPTGNPGRSA